MRERELLGVPGCETAAQRLLLLFAGHLMLHWWLQSARQTSAGLGTWCCPSARVGFIDNWAEVGYVTYLQLRDRCLTRICAILGTDVWLFTFNTEVLDPFRTQRGFFLVFIAVLLPFVVALRTLKAHMWNFGVGGAGDQINPL